MFLLPIACLSIKEPVATPGLSPSPRPSVTPYLISPMPTRFLPSPTPEKFLSVEQKIGQLMVVGFDGTTVDADLHRMITEYHIGGVILFDRNIESPPQVAALTNELQRIALESGHPGLLIAIDQEGGRVARLTEATGFTEFPSAMALTATGDSEHAYQVGAAIAAEMRAVGLNVNLAPDLDVNNNPANPVIGVRSFSSDPQKVAEYGLAFARGLQENGVLAFAKHFPGHGDTDVDSHFDLPLVLHSRAHLDQIELVPFKAAITARVAGIMSAHIAYPAIDPAPGRPGTLSRAMLTGLLRDELGYQGLIVTDSLEMGALSANGWPPADAAPLALAAGADLLLFNRDHAMHRAVFDRLLQSVKAGKISQAQLDGAVRRVLQAKARFGLLNPAQVEIEFAAAAVKTAEHLALSRALALQSITLLRDPLGLLPLKTDSPPLIVEPAAVRGLTEGLGLGGVILPVEAQPTRAEIAEVLRAATNGRTVIVPVNDLNVNPQQLKLIQELVAAGSPVIVLAQRNPFDALQLPGQVTLLVTYGFNPPAREAVAAVLVGESQAGGLLPVTLP